MSVYIADAPHPDMSGKLIKDGLIHDWHWLLIDHLEWAEPLGLVVRGLAYGLVEGLVVCAGAVGLMVWYLVRDFREAQR